MYRVRICGAVWLISLSLLPHQFVTPPRKGHQNRLAVRSLISARPNQLTNSIFFSQHPDQKPTNRPGLVSSSSNLLAKELSRGGVMEASMLLARPHLSFPCGASSRSIASTSAKQVDLETWVWDLRFAFFFRSDLTAFSCHCNLSSEFLTGEAAIFY